MRKNNKFEFNFPAVFIIYTILILLITFPAIVKLNTIILGCRYTETWHAVWGLHLVKDSILNGKSLFFTDKIFHPQGGYFYPINLINGILILPIYSFLPLPVSYNVMIISFMLIAALGMYRLVLLIVKNKNAAFYSGICYAVSPMVINSIHNGTDEALGLCWIPYFFFYLLRFFNGGGMRFLILTILFLFLSAVSCWYIGLSLTLFIIFFLIYQIFTPDKNLKIILKKAVVVFSIAAILILPLFRIFYRCLTADKRVIHCKNKKEITWVINNLTYTNVNTYFKIRPFWLSSKNDSAECNAKAFFNPDSDFSKVIYLGYIALALCLFNLISGKRVAINKKFWIFCMLFFFLFSLGPNPHFNHQKLKIGILNKLLPYSLIDYILPLSSFACLIYRFSIIMYLSLFIVAGAGLARMLSRVPIKSKAMLTFFISTCSIFEYLMLAPLPYPLKYSPAIFPKFVAELKRQPGRAIIECPVNDRIYRSLRPGFYYQIYHHKKVPYSIGSYEGICPMLRTNMFLNYLDRICQPNNNLAGGDNFFLHPNEFSRFEIKQAIEELKVLSFSHVVVYKDIMPRKANEALPLFLETYLDKPYWESEKTAVYKIE